MFGPRNYVPVLKVKRGEKAALASLRSNIQQRVVPLLEVVERTQSKTVDEHLETSFRGLAASVQGFRRCLLDVRELEPEGSLAADSAFGRAAAEGISFTPVTGISRTADVASALRYSSVSGLGIRLTREEFEMGNLPASLNSFLLANGLTPNRVDLIVDLGPVGDLITAGVMALTQAFLADVPTIRQWRTLTVTGSAFPLSMGVVTRNSSMRIPRSEWLAWRDGLHAQRLTSGRLPTFSDCAIQHPAGVENLDFRIISVSATIRYTSTDDWLLVKGESTRRNPPSTQFPQLATRLVYGQLQSAFAGAQHCAGCQQAKDSADSVKGLGSPEVWRRIGTIHHITTVVQDDLASLQWP